MDKTKKEVNHNAFKVDALPAPCAETTEHMLSLARCTTKTSCQPAAAGEEDDSRIRMAVQKEGSKVDIDVDIDA